MDVLLSGLGFAVSSISAAIWGYRFINHLTEWALVEADEEGGRAYYKVIEPYPEIKVFDIEEDDNLDSDSESENDEDVLVVG
jgi:hypothetical protein